MTVYKYGDKYEQFNSDTDVRIEINDIDSDLEENSIDTVKMKGSRRDEKSTRMYMEDSNLKNSKWIGIRVQYSQRCRTIRPRNAILEEIGKKALPPETEEKGLPDFLFVKCNYKEISNQIKKKWIESFEFEDIEINQYRNKTVLRYKEEFKSKIDLEIKIEEIKFIESKNGDGQLSKNQKEWISKHCENYNVQIFRVYNEEDNQ